MADAVPQPAFRPSALWGLLLALVLFACLGSAAIALEKPTGEASGQVLSVAGERPLVGATVTVTGPVTRHLLTGPDGKFRFYHLPTGSYYLSAKQHGYDPQFQESSLEIDEGQVKGDLAFKLARTNPSLDITNTNRVFTPKAPLRILARGTSTHGLDVALYHVDVLKAMASDPELKLLHHPVIADLLKAHLITPLRTWHQPLPREAMGDDDWFFKPVAIDNAGEGTYVVEISDQPDALPEDVKAPARQKIAYWFDVTRLALVAKRSADKLVVYGADLVERKPIANVKITTYHKGGGLAQATSGADGLATFDTPADTTWALGQVGSSLALVPAKYDNDASAYRIYAYTERPVYRPGQKVYFKAVVRTDNNRPYQLPVGSGTIELKDGTGTHVEQQAFTLSKTGSFDGSFELSPDAKLGDYDADISLGNTYQSINFKVADYRKPEYKVDLTPDKPRYVQGTHAKIHLVSSYYFGAPVPAAKLQITVYSAPQYNAHDPNEDFFAGYTTDNEDGSVWGFGDVVQQTEGLTDAQGHYDLDVALPAKAADDGWPGDRSYTVAVEALDASGRPVKAHQSFTVTQGLYKLDLQADNYLYVDKQPIKLNLGTHDYDGKPLSADVKLSIERLTSVKTTDKDGNDSWDTVRTPVWSGSGHTDAHGLGLTEVPGPGAGNYAIHATSKDTAGNTIEAIDSAWVASEAEMVENGGGDTTSGSLKIVLDRKVYKPGQLAKALIVSPVADAYALVTVEGAGLSNAHVVKLHGLTGLVTLPITQSEEPNAYVAACIVNGMEFLETSRSLNVTPEDKFLRVSVKTDKPRYQPGDRAIYTVQTTDLAGKPVSAEVSLGVVDQAVYAIDPEETADMRYFFHGPRDNRVQTMHSFAEDYSGGLDKFAPDPRVRTKFEDTAAWFPSLQTDADGLASVTITLPDNLTTWVATARAATLDTHVGSAASTCVATKDLLVRLEVPRFLVEGDHALVSGIVHNYTEAVQQIKVSLGLTGLATQAPLEQLAAVSPGDAKRLTWDVTAPTPGDVTAQVTARGQTAADAMALTFPVEANGMPQFQAYAGTADADKPGFASLDLPADAIAGTLVPSFQLNATPLAAILGGIDYLHSYPYGCVEQTMSRFLPDVVVKPALDAAHLPYGNRFADQTKHIAEGLRRLVSMQHGDGGWGWWENDATELEMTSYVVSGLAAARVQGTTIPPTVLKRGLDNLDRAVPRIKKDLFTHDMVRRGGGADARALALYALASWGKAPKAELDRLWGDRTDLSHYGLAQLTVAFALQHDERKLQALDALRGSVEETGTQAHWNSDSQEFTWNDNATETTAMGLRALLLIAPSDPLIQPLIRWLESKNGRGYWDSTKDTGAAVIALAEAMRVHPPDAGHRDVVVTVNGAAAWQGSTDVAASGAQAVTLPPALLKTGRNDVQVQVTGSGALDFSGGLAFLQRANKTSASPAVGLSVTRDYFNLPAEVYAKAKGAGFGAYYEPAVVKGLAPLGPQTKSGDRVLVRVSVQCNRTLRYMALEDPLPAGCEILEDQPTSWGYWWDHQEYRDDRASFFFNTLSAGTHILYYVMRPTTPGQFHVLPTTTWAMYAPDVRAHGATRELAITE